MHDENPTERISSELEPLALSSPTSSSPKERRKKVNPWDLACHSTLANLAGYALIQKAPGKRPCYAPLNCDTLLRLMHNRPYADVVLRGREMQVINNWSAVLLARACNLREISVRLVHYSDDELPELIYLDIMTHIQSIPDSKLSKFKKDVNQKFIAEVSDLLVGVNTQKLRAFLPKSSAHRLTDPIPGSTRGRRKKV